MTKVCRIITDNRVGNLNPALALAEAISSDFPLEIEQIIVKKNIFFQLMPAWLLCLLSSRFFIKSFFNITYNPDVVLTIGNGSASIVPCLLLSTFGRKQKNNGLFVQLQNPRIHHGYFDFIVAPVHDNLRGKNIISIIGSLSRVKNVLQKTEFKIPDIISRLKRPLIGVFIGGKNSRYDFSEAEAKKLAEYLLNYSQKNNLSLAITCSRRTSKKNEAILRSLLIKDNIYFPDKTHENPYFMLLKLCDAAIVTSDSVNMISDTITAGLPTYLFELQGKSGKFSHFYQALKEKNLLFTISDTYEQKNIDNFDETQRVSRILVTALVKQANNN